jgi:hypothetical protein
MRIISKLVLATFVALNLKNSEKIWKQQNFVLHSCRFLCTKTTQTSGFSKDTAKT